MFVVYLVNIAQRVFDEIIRKFAVIGHAHISCYRDFAHLESLKKVSSSSESMDFVQITGDVSKTKPLSPSLLIGLMTRSD
jgi:hypothetical protein